MNNYTDFLEQTLKEQINITLAVLNHLGETGKELAQMTDQRDYWKEKADAYRARCEKG